MEGFNWVDYIFLAICFISILAGFTRGLVRELLSLIILIAAFAIAATFANQLAVHFTSSESVQHVVNQTTNAIGTSTEQPVSYAAIGISFAVLFLGTVIIGCLIGFFVNVILQTSVLGIGNRLLGAVFGLGRGLIISLVIIFLIELTPMHSEEWWQNSQIVQKSKPTVVWLGKVVSPSLDDLKSRFEEAMKKAGSSMQDKMDTIIKPRD